MAMIRKLRFKPPDIEKLYKDQVLEYSNFAINSFSWRYLEMPLIDKVLSLVSTKNPKVIDAGCGTGRTLEYLLEKRISKENLIGVDISDEMLAITNKNVPQVKTIKADLTSFKIEGKFDIVICTHVFHYLDEKDLRKTLKIFYNLLKKNGILFLVITHPVRTTRHNLAEYFKRDWIIDHTPWGTASPLFLRPVADFVNETIKAGFAILSLEEPSVPLKAKKADLVNYLKYACCPSRVAVIARKQKS